ncbi:LAGLIDADG family homing endonuclease [Pseudonocardia sp. RS010]|uniref:LAGLIDADG family homing endonuclease n=1 Tax=Pseudonocardia sp. RS010 TaxID=3385979 RepID=UPI00399F40D6
MTIGPSGSFDSATPVPTPHGWTPHGELTVGSEVYARDGSITTITATLPGRVEPLFEVEFRNGETISCTSDQRWPMGEFRGIGRVSRISTIAEMLKVGLIYERRLTSGRTKATRGGVARWRGEPSPAVFGHHVDAGLPPYVLGYWLGDGDRDGPRITAHQADLPSLRYQFAVEGVPLGEPKRTHGETIRVRFGSRGIAMKALRDGNLYMNKHVPSEMLRASLPQRWDLLQGLVDSDGSVGQNGVVEVSLSDPGLAGGVIELAKSLGLMPTASVNRSYLNGEEYRMRTRIKFTPRLDEAVCRLPRKLERTRRPRRHTNPFSRSRTVVAVEPVGPSSTSSVVVEDGSHQYLVGRDFLVACDANPGGIPGADHGRESGPTS